MQSNQRYGFYLTVQKTDDLSKKWYNSHDSEKEIYLKITDMYYGETRLVFNIYFKKLFQFQK